MNHSEQRLCAARRHNEAIVAGHLHELFRRLPTLAGFWLHPDLKVAEAVFTGPATPPAVIPTIR